MSLNLKDLKFDNQGLIPVVAQDESTGAVLMVAWANEKALELTAETGLAHFYSRSRQQLWCKGETSGNHLNVVSSVADCDRDTILLRVRPEGPACHLMTRTCFESGPDSGVDSDADFGRGGNPAQLELGWLYSVLTDRMSQDPEVSYTAKLLRSGVDRISRKVGEESAETIIAAVRADAARGGLSKGEIPGPLREELVGEAGDLLYHLMVLLRSLDVSPLEVAELLSSRHQKKEITS